MRNIFVSTIIDCVRMINGERVYSSNDNALFSSTLRLLAENFSARKIIGNQVHAAHL